MPTSHDVVAHPCDVEWVQGARLKKEQVERNLSQIAES